MRNERWYSTTTKNGSEVRIKEWTSPGTAWTCRTRRRTYFIDALNDADYNLIEELGLPRWHFDYTGRGMVFSDSDNGYVRKMQLDALSLQFPLTALKLESTE